MPGRTAGFWIILLILVFFAFQMMNLDQEPVYDITYTAFEQQVCFICLNQITRCWLI